MKAPKILALGLSFAMILSTITPAYAVSDLSDVSSDAVIESESIDSDETTLLEDILLTESNDTVSIDEEDVLIEDVSENPDEDKTSDELLTENITNDSSNEEESPAVSENKTTDTEDEAPVEDTETNNEITPDGDGDFLLKSYKVVVGGTVDAPELAKTSADNRYSIKMLTPVYASISKEGVIKGKQEGDAGAIINKNEGEINVAIKVYSLPSYKEALTANVGDNLNFGLSIGGIPVEYASSNEAVATISNKGVVTTVAKGTTVLTAKVQGVTVKATLNVYEPKLSGADVVYVGKIAQFKILDGFGTTYWASSDDSVATISEKGVVTGISKGSVTIAAVNNDVEVKKTVHVHNIPSFTQKEYTINNDEVLENIFNDDGIGDVKYSVDNNQLASVDNSGRVTGIAKGKVTLTAVCAGNKYTTKINIIKAGIVAADYILLNKSATLKVSGGSGSTTWSSSDPSIISITDKGKITGLKTGTATITAINNGKNLTKTITVYETPGFDRKSATLNKDDEVNYFSAKDIVGFTFSSSNTKAAVVDENGKITAVGSGSANIIARYDKLKYTLKVKVFDQKLVYSDVIYTSKTATFKLNKGNGKTVWNSSDTSVATVTQKGKVTAIKDGIVQITATNNNKVFTADVVVRPEPKFEKTLYVTNMTQKVKLTFVDLPDTEKVTFTPSSDKVASISSEGYILPHKAGDIKVTAKIRGIKYTTKVKVCDPEITGPSKIKIGKAAQLKIKNGYGPTKWLSTNTSAVTIDEAGIIKGVGTGGAVIYADNCGMHVEYTVHVLDK